MTATRLCDGCRSTVIPEHAQADPAREWLAAKLGRWLELRIVDGRWVAYAYEPNGKPHANGYAYGETRDAAIAAVLGL